MPQAREEHANASQKAGPWEEVRVKFFNRDKGFGFLIRDSTEPDIYISSSLLERKNMRDLKANRRVEVRSVQNGKKNPTAIDIRLVNTRSPR